MKNYSPEYFQEVRKWLERFGLTFIKHGKVRDIYSYKDKLIMVTTDRISAFDVVSKQTLPYKGQIINEIAGHFLNQARSICPVWLTGVPNQNTSIGIKCEPIKVEMVIRGQLCGSAWREYEKGIRVICEATMPEGMIENDFFLAPISTPTTKVDNGHDKNITEAEIIKKGLATKDQYRIMKELTFEVFEQGDDWANKHNLYLADTKYEFGLDPDGKIMLIDEVNTPDSSRYFQRKGFEERQRNGEEQIQISKEFVREWFIKAGYNKEIGGDLPIMPDEIIAEFFKRYSDLYQRLLGSAFQPENLPVNHFVESIMDSLNDIK